MRRLKSLPYDDCGSATVEMCFVMPVILFIIINMIFLFLDSVNDGIIRGNIYTALYSYDEDGNVEVMQCSLEEDIRKTIIGNTYPAINAYSDDGEVGIDVRGDSNVPGELYIYEPEDMRYSVETGVCTSRLRRWQMYGDILWE